MRPREEELIDPEIAEQLDAIDATLAGEPVDPRFAELAELALLLAAGRPEGMRAEFAAELDRRVAGRFGRGEPGRSASAQAPGGAGRGRRWRRWGMAPVLGSAGAALAAAVIAVVVVTSGGGPRGVNGAVPAGPAPALSTATTTTASSSAKSVNGTAATASHPLRVGPLAGASHSTGAKSVPPEASPAAVQHTTGSVVNGAGGSAAASKGSGAGASAAASQGAGAAASKKSPAAPYTAPPTTIATGPAPEVNQALAPAPVPNGRKVVQSSTLELGAPGKRLGVVAQEVFYVVRGVNAIVASSNVSSTTGPSGYAQFQLRVPSPALPQALEQLSRLRYASVISRSDATQDVNSPYLSAERAITNDKVAIARLRTELASASLETQIVSLRAQIAKDKSALARAQSSLTSLNRGVDYSSVSVSVQATTGSSRSGDRGFGVVKAGHDALRVLEVTAGVALIALAVLVPIGLLLALAWWVALTVQRRRRERALDLA